MKDSVLIEMMERDTVQKGESYILLRYISMKDSVLIEMIGGEKCKSRSPIYSSEIPHP
jgi:hypothetical protein